MAGHRLTQKRIRDYAELTTDRNPLHVDEGIASESRFGGLIAHGFLLLGGPLSRAGEKLQYPVTLQCRFLSPGRPDDELHSNFSSIDSESCSFEVRTSDGELKITGTIRSESSGLRTHDSRSP